MSAIRFDVNDAALRDVFFRRLLFDALRLLRDDARPSWGRMTAQEMVEHLTWAFELSTGRARAECRVPDEQREGRQVFLYDNRPTPHDFPNPLLAAGLPPLRHARLAAAIAALRVEVERFLAGRDATQAMPTHPVFGPLGMEEWARSHFKHTYHHLLQFGLICGDGEVVS